MEIEEIEKKINIAIQNLFKKDIGILKRGLSELTLSNKLVEYLRPLFEEYDVDTEYNGDYDKPNDRKALDIAKNRIIEIKRKNKESNNYKIVPDIIIHKRETNNCNLVVIEVKKDTSSKNDIEYDFIKLEHLTINYMGNHYNYDAGLSIVLGVGENAGRCTIYLFEEGIMKRKKII